MLIFGVDNSSTTYTDNHKNDFSMLSEREFGINGSFDAPEKNFSINFSKTRTKFCLSLR